jgi:hypothetical protein
MERVRVRGNQHDLLRCRGVRFLQAHLVVQGDLGVAAQYPVHLDQGLAAVFGVSRHYPGHRLAFAFEADNVAHLGFEFFQVLRVNTGDTPPHVPGFGLGDTQR